MCLVHLLDINLPETVYFILYRYFISPTFPFCFHTNLKCISVDPKELIKLFVCSDINSCEFDFFLLMVLCVSHHLILRSHFSHQPLNSCLLLVLIFLGKSTLMKNIFLVGSDA